ARATHPTKARPKPRRFGETVDNTQRLTPQPTHGRGRREQTGVMRRASGLPVAPTMAVFDHVQRPMHLIHHSATETTATPTCRLPRLGGGLYRLGRTGGKIGRRRRKAREGVRDTVPRRLGLHPDVRTWSHARVVVQSPGW